MKFGPVTRIILASVLVLAAVGAVAVIDRIPLRRFLAIAGISVTVSDMDTTPTVSPATEPVERRIADLSRATVAVQTFSGPTLVRSGSGVAVSADGLILTTWAVAPYGSGSSVYQVVTARGGILRARRVASDPTGLVLLRTDAADLPAATFDVNATVPVGQEAWAIAARINTSRFSPVVAPLRVVYEDASGAPVYSLDRSLLPLLSGAQVVTAQGKLLGLVRPGGGFSVISATTVNTFLARYLAGER